MMTETEMRLFSSLFGPHRFFQTWALVLFSIIIFVQFARFIRLLLLYYTIGTNINYTLASKLALRAAFIVASMEAALALNASEAVFFIPAPSDATTDADNLIDI